MDISPETISKYKIKKVLKISIFILLFFVIGLLIFEYFRITPRNVHFSNITSSSVTVSWNTKSLTSATVIPFEGKSILPIRLFCFFKEKFFDTRDIERAELESIESIEQRVIDSEDGKLSTEDFEVEVTRKGRYTTHHVKVKNLEPNTQYSFVVGDSILFKRVKQSTGEDTITTTAIEEELKTPSPTYGSVLNANSNSDVALTELPPVSDGIVYLNLYDKESDKRSNIFSSSLNKEGKWYIDISNAIDSEGNNFVETYSFEGVNMYYELELDAGELGRWKTMDLASALSPSQPFVINTPDTIQDIEIPGSVVKLSNNVLGTFVPSSYAADGDCAFSKYCVFVIEKNGDYETINQSNASDCNNYDYINSTMIARKCAGANQTPEQENAGLSCSGKPVGTVGYNNKACYLCQKQTQNGYFVARWVPTSDYIAEGIKCVKKEEPVVVPVDEEEEEEEEEVDNDKDGKKLDIKNITKDIQCTDADGCHCHYSGWGRTVEDKQWCRINSCSGGYVGEILNINGTCYKCTAQPLESKYNAILVQTSNYKVSGTTCVNSSSNIKEGDSCRLDSCYCESSGKTIKKGFYCTDDKRSVMSISGMCYDIDGCICNSEEIHHDEECITGQNTTNIPEIKDNEYCTQTNCLCRIYKDNRLIVSKTVNKDGYCTIDTTIDTTIDDTRICESTNKDGEPCTIEGSIILGSWVGCECVKPDTIEGKPCWESNNLLFRNLVYYENDKRLSCENEIMVPVEDNGNSSCKEGENCLWWGWSERCFDSETNTLLYCHAYKDGKTKWSEENIDKSDYFMINVVEITPNGTQCTSDVCLCTLMANNIYRINTGQWCKETDSCNSYVQSKICNVNGNTCEADKCTGPIKSFSLQPSFQLLSNSIVPKAFAQASETQEYIIDSSTGLISGITSGIYTFELDGTTYMFFVDEEALASNNGKILIFIDKDNNGIYDEGTDTKVSELASKLAISTIQKEYSYKLKQGFNFVSFPFLNVTESARTALGLLEMLNILTNGSVYSIAKFDSSWEIVGKNGETYLSNDFQLIPGQGYVIKVIKDVEVSMQGYPIKFESEEDSAPITLFTGWNLIGVYGSKAKVYTAKSMLQDINAFEEIDFTADIVNGWDQEAQSYEGFVLENTNGIESEYGFDFPINTLKSYFVRVQDGKGNWQPSLAE